MARPPKTAGSSTTETLTAKVTKGERRELEALITRKNQVALMQGHGAITLSFYIRGLIVRDLAAEKERTAAAVTTLSTEKQVETISKSLPEHEPEEPKPEPAGGTRGGYQRRLELKPENFALAGAETEAAAGTVGAAMASKTGTRTGAKTAVAEKAKVTTRARGRG